MDDISTSNYGKSLLCETALVKSAGISVATQKGKCRYHTDMAKDFDSSQLTPDGLCIHAFHSVYSSCLDLLYSGRRNRLITQLYCPDARACVEFEILAQKHASIKFRLMQTLRYYLRRLGVPCDCLLKRIMIKVTNVKRDCPMGHKIGDTFEFNLSNKPEICPASFESIYPVVYAVRLEKISAKVGTVNADENICLECPSHTVNIRYHIPKER